MARKWFSWESSPSLADVVPFLSRPLSSKSSVSLVPPPFSLSSLHPEAPALSVQPPAPRLSSQGKESVFGVWEWGVWEEEEVVSREGVGLLLKIVQ